MESLVSDSVYFNTAFIGQYFRREAAHPHHFFVETLRLFLSETEKRLQELKNNLNQTDKLVSTLHYLKGSASQVGGQKLSIALEQAEHLVSLKATFPKAEWKKLIHTWTNTRKEIEKWLADLPQKPEGTF